MHMAFSVASTSTLIKPIHQPRESTASRSYNYSASFGNSNRITNINSSLQTYQIPCKNTTNVPTSPSPKWNFLQKAAAMALDAVETTLISREIQHPLPKTTDPEIQIAGNFAPVPEHPISHNLPVNGGIW